VTWGALVFRGGAFVALAVLVRHTLRTEGARAGGILVAYLVAFACFREWFVSRMALIKHDLPPYTPTPGPGQLGPINVLVVAGWVFTALLSFALAKMIQRRNLPGTNIFLTLALTALVATAIGYAVETTGIRVPLWKWNNPQPTSWLPFDCPFDAFDAWGTTAFVIMGIYCAVRFHLFAVTASRRIAAGVVLLLVFWAAVFAVKWFGEGPPHQKVVLLYLALCVVLGFKAPRWMLGSSESALR
jgi:hypothetical protein